MCHTLYALGLPIERWLDNVCGDVFATDFDQYGSAGLRKAHRHIAQPDALLEKRREIAAGDIAGLTWWLMGAGLLLTASVFVLL